MIARIKHLGKPGDPGIAVGGYTLMPGFTSPNVSIVDGSSEHDKVSKLVREGTIELLPADPGGRDMGRSTLAAAPGGLRLSRDAVRAKMELIGRGNIPLNNVEHERNHRGVGSNLSAESAARVFKAEDLKKLGGRPPERPKKVAADILPQRLEAKKTKKFSADELRQNGPVPPKPSESISEDDAIAKSGSTLQVAEPGKVMTADEVRVLGGKHPVLAEKDAEMLSREASQPSEDEEKDSTPPEVELGAYTVSQLKAFAEDHEIEIPKNAKKADIVTIVGAWCADNGVEFEI
jgi:hypothetical protein